MTTPVQASVPDSYSPDVLAFFAGYEVYESELRVGGLHEAKRTRPFPLLL